VLESQKLKNQQRDHQEYGDETPGKQAFDEFIHRFVPETPLLPAADGDNSVAVNPLPPDQLISGNTSRCIARVLNQLENAGAVGSTKTERVRHGYLEVGLPSGIGNVIEITLRILVFQVDGRWHNLVT